MRCVVGLALVLACASSASAQSTYVGVSFIGDVVRTSGAATGGNVGNGESFGGALRIGTPLGDRWGVELELARSGEIDATPSFNILAAQTTSFRVEGSAGPDPVIPPRLSIFPSPTYSAERQFSTISTLLWWHHEVNSRVSLVYLGGVAFTRTEFDVEISYPDFPIGFPIPVPTIPRRMSSETVSYDADVAVGFEGRIGMTEHVRLVPGVRLQTVAAGWAIRPGIGIQWTF